MTYLETTLGSVGAFKGLSRSELREIARIGSEAEFPAGSTLVEQGLQGADFYLILEGQARLQVPKKEPRTIGPGDSFGEISVLDGGPRTATVTAETRVLAYRISREQFLPLLDRHGSIGRKILVEMSGRLRYAESRMPE
jgi:CRP/FNR family transcriptional regulator, cyclic AMP receptor protein